jgi:hypothetical protein
MVFTDEGLKHLTGLNQLKSVSLYGTKATPAGAKKLQAEVPGLRVSGPGPAPVPKAGQ